MKRLSIGFSPCPNDTFIFDAMINDLIDTGDFKFDVVMEDVETLNQMAIQNKLDISKISYGVLDQVYNDYDVLTSGSALGRGVGPLLISKGKIEFNHEIKVALPGEHTTAHKLFSFAYPHMSNKVFMRYDEIENFVLQGLGLGVIIHENRFTYESKGLVKIADLGKVWEDQTGYAIPLGGIVIRKMFNEEIKTQINDLIRKSLDFSFDRQPALSAFIKDNAREMSEDVMRLHIDLYVNNFSKDLGEEGKNAIKYFVATNSDVKISFAG